MNVHIHEGVCAKMMQKRNYPHSPIVGVGAAVYRGNEVLLIKRGNPPLQDTWSLPGGTVQEREDLRSALRREIREECTIEVTVGDLITIFEYVEKDAADHIRYHYIVFDFKATYRRGTLTRSSDARDTRWVPLDQISHYDLTKKAIEVVEKGIQIK